MNSRKEGSTMDLKKTIILLGLKARDKITGITGVITSVAFDLYGCIQVVINPQKIDKEGNPMKGNWFDINRLEILSKKPVMEILDFTQKYPNLITPAALIMFFAISPS